MPRTFHPTLLALEDRCVPAADPVLVIPGFGGSLPPPNQFNDFIYHQAYDPARLSVFKGVYGPLIASLKAAGYREGVSLFEVPYDWRLPIAPPDGTRDGRLDTLTAASI